MSQYQSPWQKKGDLSVSFGQAEKEVDSLAEEKRRLALQLSEQIDPKNYQSIEWFGNEAQSRLLNFSHAMLERVQKNDVGEIGNILNDLMKKLEQVSPDELKPAKKKSVFAYLWKDAQTGSRSIIKISENGSPN